MENRTWDAELVLTEPTVEATDRVACETVASDGFPVADTQDEVVSAALAEAREWYDLGWTVEIQTYKTTKARGREADKSFYVRPSQRRVRGRIRLVASRQP